MPPRRKGGKRKRKGERHAAFFSYFDIFVSVSCKNTKNSVAGSKVQNTANKKARSTRPFLFFVLFVVVLYLSRFDRTHFALYLEKK